MKPRRWEIEATGCGDDVEMIERPKGNYVLFEDYARLKAEVERLTEAGDEMAVCFNCPTCAKNWNDAKKGGQP